MKMREEKTYENQGMDYPLSQKHGKEGVTWKSIIKKTHVSRKYLDTS